jgi:hypothetical protein
VVRQSDHGRLVVPADRSVSVATAVWLAEVMRRAQQAGVPSGDHGYRDALIREFVRLRSQPPVELLC